MISINNISVSFSGNYILKDISFVINKKSRIGLTGKNGAGKSTLLKLICNEIEAESGEISLPKETTIGYLPQKTIYPEGKTVFLEASTVFQHIFDIEAKIESLFQELSGREDYESESYLATIEQINHLQDMLNNVGAKNYEEQIERTLKGLGFESSDFNRDLSEFSGGWRMRVELAKILLKKPDLLLLDEPTNHLDILSIEWLEQFLISYPGAVVLISHDRVFLDSITDRTIEIVKGKLYDYKVPYSQFEVLRKERIEQQKSAYVNQQKMIQDTETFIERFRYKNTKAVQVQSRVKQLEKLERIEIDETDISDLSFKFPDAPHSGEVSLEIEGLTQRYTDVNILENIWLTIERGQKVAFVGRNGEGKTTLVRIIKGELEYEGNLKLGHQIKIGYFAQNQDKILDETKTVFETLDDIAVGDVRTKVRDILGNFLFSGEDIDKKVEVLSGGERSRLAMAKLMLQPNNLLILDEPTNHLDMHSKEMLKKALLNFNGTIILVSHDRAFLEGLTDEIFEFRNKQIHKHSGDINLFLKKKRSENFKIFEKSDQNKKNDSEENEVSENKDLYLKRKEFDKKIRKYTKRYDEVENEILNLENFISSTEEKLSSADHSNDPDIYKKFDEATTSLKKHMKEWEELTEIISKMNVEKEQIK